MNAMTQPLPELWAPRCKTAFTLLELLVVIVLVGLLAGTLLPALARSGSDVQKVNCLNNKRQLCLAWRFYADDNSDRLVPNYEGTVVVGGSGGTISWCAGWLDWGIRADNTNTAFLTNPKYAKLAPYINNSANVFKCPTDRYLAAIQRAAGWTQRVRSVSLNIGIGEGNAEQGPWDPIYKHASKFTQLLYPTPAESYLFLDEDQDSINDPAFFCPHQTSWIDIPASYHYGGAGFGFADSHAEIHKWTGSLAHLGSTSVGDPDIHWTSYHATRTSNNSY